MVTISHILHKHKYISSRRIYRCQVFMSLFTISRTSLLLFLNRQTQTSPKLVIEPPASSGRVSKFWRSSLVLSIYRIRGRARGQWISPTCNIKPNLLYVNAITVHTAESIQPSLVINKNKKVLLPLASRQLTKMSETPISGLGRKCCMTHSNAFFLTTQFESWLC